MNDNICKSELYEAIISHIATMEATNDSGYYIGKVKELTEEENSRM